MSLALGEVQRQFEEYKAQTAAKQNIGFKESPGVRVPPRRPVRQVRTHREITKGERANQHPLARTAFCPEHPDLVNPKYISGAKEMLDGRNAGAVKHEVSYLASPCSYLNDYMDCLEELIASDLITNEDLQYSFAVVVSGLRRIQELLQARMTMLGLIADGRDMGLVQYVQGAVAPAINQPPTLSGLVAAAIGDYRSIYHNAVGKRAAAAAASGSAGPRDRHHGDDNGPGPSGSGGGGGGNKGNGNKAKGVTTRAQAKRASQSGGAEAPSGSI